MLKKKFYEWLAWVLIYVCMVLVIYVASASAAVSFQYSDAVATEYDFNQFVANITSNSSYTPLQIQSAILLSGEKSPNIRMTNIVKIPSGYLVYGNLIDYNITTNKLFNPWFNASWENRIIYNMSNIEYRKVVNMSNGDGIITYNKSDRWFNYSDNQPLSIFNYTLIGGQTFVHIKGNLNGNTQWVKYINTTNFYPGVENASLTYNFYDNINQTGTFNTTKWIINLPAFMTASVVTDNISMNCLAGCDVGRSTFLQGNENLTQFSNIIWDWYPGTGSGLAGSIAKNGDYSVTSYVNSEAWVRQDDLCYSGTETASSGDVCVIPIARQKTEINRTPYYNKYYKNDTLLDNKTTNIHNGQEVPTISPFTASRFAFMYSVIGYNRSANATFTTFQTLTYQPLNFTSWSNNRTNDTSLSISTTYPNTILFNATTSVFCDNCSWYVNGVPFANQTLLNQTNLTYSFVSAGTYYINLTAINDTFSNTAYLNWTVTAFNPVAIANLDGFVNNTPLGAYVNGVRVDLISTTGGANFTTWSQNHLLGNVTNIAPTIEPSSPGTGERVINVTYWANNSDVEVLVFAHAMSVSETAGVFVYIDDVFVAGQSGRPLAGAETAYREITVTIPRYSSYRINFTNFHHYEWRESPLISGYYAFKNVPTGSYTLLFQQVAYNNLTASISLTANTRYNATISPTLIIEDDDSDIESLSVFAFVLGMFLLILIIRYRKKVDKYLFDKRII